MTLKSPIDSSLAAQNVPPLEREGQRDTEVPSTFPRLARIKRALIGEVSSLNVPLMCANVAISILPNLGFPRLRAALYRLAGIKIGPHSLILGRMQFTGSPPRAHRLRIGANTVINSHCFFDLNGEITIGDRVSVGHHVTFITANHELG